LFGFIGGRTTVFDVENPGVRNVALETAQNLRQIGKQFFFSLSILRLLGLRKPLIGHDSEACKKRLAEPMREPVSLPKVPTAYAWDEIPWPVLACVG